MRELVQSYNTRTTEDFIGATLALYTEFNNLLVFREGLSCRHHLLPGQAYNMFMIVFMLSLRILINPLIEILSIN